MAFDMNSGYSGWSLSRRAVEAYEDGEMPKSKWTKAAMLGAMAAWCLDNDRMFESDVTKTRKADLFSGFFVWSSWHHTSKFANETDFYSLDEDELGERTVDLTDEARSIMERWEVAVRREHDARVAEARLVLESIGTTDDYKATHGCACDSCRAFVAMHPEAVESERTSRSGNRIVSLDTELLPERYLHRDLNIGKDKSEKGGWHEARFPPSVFDARLDENGIDMASELAHIVQLLEWRDDDKLFPTERDVIGRFKSSIVLGAEKTGSEQLQLKS